MKRAEALALRDVMAAKGYKCLVVALAKPKSRGYCVSHFDAVFGRRQITEATDVRAIRLMREEQWPK